VQSIREESATKLGFLPLYRNESRAYRASFGNPRSNSNIESSIGINPSIVPCKLINIFYFAKRASIPTLISRSLVEGLSMIPVSSKENLFCASFLNSSTVAYPYFCAIAEAKLIVDN